MGIKGWASGLVAIGAAGEYGIVRYLFRRTVVRGNVKWDKTQKMTGTDWDAYILGTRASRKRLARQPQEDAYTTSRDGPRLHGTFFYCEGSRRVAVCFHGYASEELNDHTSIAKFYLNQGFDLMVADEKVYGKSEGTHTGFGCLDRYDALQWMEYAVERLGEDCGLMLHGISMRAATVLMSMGLESPEQAKAAVSDCAFTPVWEVFSHMLGSMHYMPASSVMQITDRMVRRETGYGLDGCNARKEVMRARIPALFIHGDRDAFVPCSMVHESYGACASPKELSVTPGASRAETYCKDTDRHEHATEELITRVFGEEGNRT